jgi:hypothetical protein
VSFSIHQYLNPKGKMMFQRGCARKRRCVPALPRVWCISPAARRWARTVIQYSLLAFVLMILIVWLGAEYEGYHIGKASDTLRFYKQPGEVCGIVQETTATEKPDNSTTTTTTIQIETFPSEPAARNSSDAPIVAHCGACGSCSNPHDISIYDATKNSLFGTTLDCAKRSFLWGRRTAAACLEEQVGFSPDCNTCWVENIVCDLRRCIFTCVWQGLFNEVNTGQTDQALNKCTHCDEVRCGPDFIVCAGANRRRAGILSDIDRNLEQEVCSAVDEQWWEDKVLKEEWEEQQQQHQQEPAHRVRRVLVE